MAIEAKHYEIKCDKCGAINVLSVLSGSNSMEKSKARKALERMEHYDKCMSGEIPPVDNSNSREEKEKPIDIEKECQKLQDFFVSQEWQDIIILMDKLKIEEILIYDKLEIINRQKKIGYLLKIKKDATLRLIKRKVVCNEWKKIILEEKTLNYAEVIKEFKSFEYIKNRIDSWIDSEEHMYKI